MLDDGSHSKKNEKFILTVRNAIISASLIGGYDVVVDDTNLHPSHERDIVLLMEELDMFGDEIDLQIKDFTGVPLEECIKRDALRDKPVGEEVILRMYNQFLKEPNV